MKNITHILIPIAFVLLAGLSFFNQNYLEATLYLLVGCGFTILYLIRAGKITQHQKFWNGLSWFLVILSVLVFMLVLLQDANREITQL